MKRLILLVGVAVLTLGLVACPTEYENGLAHIGDAPSLRVIWDNYFPMGNIIAATTFGWQAGHTADIGNPARERLLRRHFSLLTAENEMKPDQLQPTQGSFRWVNSDRIVNFANDSTHPMGLHGHVLVWHSQSPVWMAPAGNRAAAIANMRNHIRTVMLRYGTRVESWEVLNEVFASWVTGTPNAGNWRNFLRQPAANQTNWPVAIPLDTATGNCFIWYAFTIAREVADEIDTAAGRPVGTMVLYYNDYNEEATGKMNGIYFMVQEMNERFARENNGRRLIDAIGMQAHHHRGHVTGQDARPGWTRQSTAASVQTAIRRFASLGVYVSITELDITVGNTDVSVLTAAQERAQAIRYAELFRMFRNNAQYIRRVSIWGVNDNASWRHQGSPLLWDAQLRPKEAFWAVADPEAFLANPDNFARDRTIAQMRDAAVNIPASAWD
ncbi:MAG: endo-1,4-beta-xylanase [Treponema sp.]|nr:endo-1,4-beta-xylanase [Treponema sp.]